MKQIVLHALGVNGIKSQQTQVQQGENKQQKQRKEFSDKHSKVSNPKTAPSSQSLSNSTSSNFPPGFNVTSVKDSGHKQVTKPHYQNPEDPSIVRMPINKMIQQTPTPTSLASSGIGSLYEEDVTTNHSHKLAPQQHNVGKPSKESSTMEYHNESLSPTSKQYSHSHERKRANSECNMLLNADKDIVKVQHSRSDHHQLKNEVKRLTLSVEEEEIR